MMITGIYRIISPTNKIYIGQSWDVERRFRAYKNLNCKNQRKLYHSLLKHGFNAHTFSILFMFNQTPSQTELNKLEKYYLSFYRATSFELLNINDTESRGKISEETRKRMSASAKKITNRPKGLAISKETRKKLSIAGTGRKYGKPSIERLEKISKCVLQLTLDNAPIKEYYSIAEASRQSGVFASNISYCASGKLKQSGGYIWRFKNIITVKK